MNPQKYSFGVYARNYFGFLVHYSGIKVDKNKTRAIINVQPLKNKKELQSFIEKNNFSRIFISNMPRPIQQFSTLLKWKGDEKFKGEDYR